HGGAGSRPAAADEAAAPAGAEVGAGPGTGRARAGVGSTHLRLRPPPDALYPDRRHPWLRAVPGSPTRADDPSQREARRPPPRQVQRTGRQAGTGRGCAGGNASRDPRGSRHRMHLAAAARDDQLAGLRQARRGLAGLRVRHRCVHRHAAGAQSRGHAGMGRTRAHPRPAAVGGRPPLPAAGVRRRPAPVPRGDAVPRRADAVVAVLAGVAPRGRHFAPASRARHRPPMPAPQAVPTNHRGDRNMAARMRENDGRVAPGWRLAIWGGAAAVLALPALAMWLGADGVYWTALDFVVMAALLATACGGWELAMRL